MKRWERSLMKQQRTDRGVSGWGRDAPLIPGLGACIPRRQPGGSRACSRTLPWPVQKPVCGRGQLHSSCANGDQRHASPAGVMIMLELRTRGDAVCGDAHWVVVSGKVVPSSMEGGRRATRDFSNVAQAKTACICQHSVPTRNGVQLHVLSLLTSPTQVLRLPRAGTQPRSAALPTTDSCSEQIKYLFAKHNDPSLRPLRPSTMCRALGQQMSGQRQSRSPIPRLHPA
jgi:hypothetical protein